MSWSVVYLKEAQKDLKKLDKGTQVIVQSIISRVKINPLSIYEGGYGKPLANKGSIDLSGLLKIKLKHLGIRVVYKALRTENVMMIIVVGVRDDCEVYLEAKDRIEKYDL